MGKKTFFGHGRTKAFSTLEYMALTVFILGAFLIFQKYILNAMSGRWKSVGDVFSFGKQFDPREYGPQGMGGGSLECFLDVKHCCPGLNPVDDPNCRRIDTWIDRRCFERNCDCSIPPEFRGEYDLQCLQCLIDCRNLDCGSDVAACT